MRTLRRRAGLISVSVAASLFSFINPIVDNFSMASPAAKSVEKVDYVQLGKDAFANFKKFVEEGDRRAETNFLKLITANVENKIFYASFKAERKANKPIDSLWTAAVNDPVTRRAPTDEAFSIMCRGITEIRNSEGSLDTLPYSEAFKNAVVAAQQAVLHGAMVPRLLTAKDIAQSISEGDAIVFTKDQLRLGNLNSFLPTSDTEIAKLKKGAKGDVALLLVIQQTYNLLVDDLPNDPNLTSIPALFDSRGFAKGVPEKFDDKHIHDAIIVMKQFLSDFAAINPEFRAMYNLVFTDTVVRNPSFTKGTLGAVVAYRAFVTGKGDKFVEDVKKSREEVRAVPVPVERNTDAPATKTSVPDGGVTEDAPLTDEEKEPSFGKGW